MKKDDTNPLLEALNRGKAAKERQDAAFRASQNEIARKEAAEKEARRIEHSARAKRWVREKLPALVEAAAVQGHNSLDLDYKIIEGIDLHEVILVCSSLRGFSVDSRYHEAYFDRDCSGYDTSAYTSYHLVWK